jgi:putative spermidine/putrescine transport system permease protein
MRKNGLIALSFHTLVILFVLAPLVIIVLVAFTPEQTLTLPTHGLSLRWFRAILDYPDFISAFLNSIKLAFSSATL